MRRGSLSRPVRLALQHELLTPLRSFFDYGCGRGDDLRVLAKQGFAVDGWDPFHRPDTRRQRADVVNLGYVVNVIEDPIERAATLSNAWQLAKEVLIVSARLEDERDEAHVAAVRDGWVTRRGTFQKFFSHEELGAWLEGVLEIRPVAAGLGVYYVFRDTKMRDDYLATRFRRPMALPRQRESDKSFAQHKHVLEPLIAFVGQRGRLPHADEIDCPPIVEAFGSLRMAQRVVQLVTDPDAWNQIRLERSVDLLVHLALDRFYGRPPFSQLALDRQRDVRAFFSNYKAACEKADRLLFATSNADAVLFACRASSVGKVTPNALYVHVSALHDLPALLRVYEGCARVLVGTVEGATIIKLFRESPGVSYLAYPDFETDPHPALERSVHCDLFEQRVGLENFSRRANPPVLHRKELFLASAHPLRSKFERLTVAEERAGLLTDPATIGTRAGWSDRLESRGFALRGHRLVKNV